MCLTPLSATRREEAFCGGNDKAIEEEVIFPHQESSFAPKQPMSLNYYDDFSEVL